MGFLYWNGKEGKVMPQADPGLPLGSSGAPTATQLSQNSQSKMENLLVLFMKPLPEEFHSPEEGLLDLLLAREFYLSGDGKFLEVGEVLKRLDKVMWDEDGDPCLRFQESPHLFHIVNDLIKRTTNKEDWERIELKYLAVQRLLLNFLQHPVTREYEI